MNGVTMQADATTTAPLNLVEYAREHRYRVRNLHDGGPVPPARRKKSGTHGLGYTGPSDRWDAIVGRNGYVAMDGDRLSVSLEYKSAFGVTLAVKRLEAMGARVDQVGDTEVGATVSAERIEDVLRLIKVSRVKLTNPGGHVESIRPGLGGAHSA